MRKRGKTFPRRGINPIFGMDAATRNVLAAQERKALDALIEHRGALDDLMTIEACLSVAARAVQRARTVHVHLLREELETALAAFYLAGQGLGRAKASEEATGAFAMTPAELDALTVADQWVAAMREPGAVHRRTWHAALVDALIDPAIGLTQNGVVT